MAYPAGGVLSVDTLLACRSIYGGEIRAFGGGFSRRGKANSPVWMKFEWAVVNGEYQLVPTGYMLHDPMNGSLTDSPTRSPMAHKALQDALMYIATMESLVTSCSQCGVSNTLCYKHLY